MYTYLYIYVYPYLISFRQLLIVTLVLLLHKLSDLISKGKSEV